MGRLGVSAKGRVLVKAASCRCMGLAPRKCAAGLLHTVGADSWGASAWCPSLTSFLSILGAPREIQPQPQVLGHSSFNEWSGVGRDLTAGSSFFLSEG